MRSSDGIEKLSAEQDKSKWPDPRLAALVMLLVENPIERGDEESTIRASVAELRRKREQEGEPLC